MADIRLTRRGFLGTASAGAAAAGLSGCVSGPGARFDQGVASGDPLADRVVLWTRVTPLNPAPGAVPVTWQIARDDRFDDIVAEGSVNAVPERDYTAKVDAGGLEPGRRYFYRFKAGGVTSPVGRTKTLPRGAVDRVRLAVASCSNYPQGYFHAYARMAQIDDLDAVLHLGDYLYEYPEGGYSDPAVVEQGRAVVPKNELISLADYRLRYALYRSDPDLQALHAAHPFITVWDDHEIANDAYKTGAENHQPREEGPFKARREAAVRAYYEWMPVREPDSGPDAAIFRRFDFGDLASLIMLETRLVGRDQQLSYERDMVYRTQAFDVSDPNNIRPILDPRERQALPPQSVREVPLPFQLSPDGPQPILDFDRIAALDPQDLPEGVVFLPDGERFTVEILGAEDRTLLGFEQERWAAEQLRRSKDLGQRWQVIGQQVLMGRLIPPAVSLEDFDPDRGSRLPAQQIQFFNLLSQIGLPFNLDAWDGYPAARERFYKAVKQADADLIVLAGDTHNGWAFNLTDEAGEAVGVEFGTPGISSPGLENYVPMAPEAMAERLMARNPNLAYTETAHRGFMVLTLTPERAENQFHFVSTVKEPSYEPVDGPRLAVAHGARKLNDPGA